MTLAELVRRTSADDAAIDGDIGPLLEKYGEDQVLYFVVATQDKEGNPRGIIRLVPGEKVRA